jgi:diadenylate cyclase
MRTIAVFAAGERYVLQDSAAPLARAHQELATLERHKRRLEDTTRALTAMEIEDRATVADIAVVAQQLELVARVADEITGYLVELGTDAGLLGLQLDELIMGTRRERGLLLRDYGPEQAGTASLIGTDRLAGLRADDLLDLSAVAAAIGMRNASDPDAHVVARGHRLLGQIPRLPQVIADSLVGHFGALQKLLSASAQDLQHVPKVDAAMALTVRDGLSRIAEAALLERYS